MSAQTETVSIMKCSFHELELMGNILVPVIAVFTKYEQFKFNIRMKLEDEDHPDWKTEAPREAEKVFQQHYRRDPEEMPHFVCLESEGLKGIMYS